MNYDHPFSYQLYREDQPGVPADPDGKDRKPGRTGLLAAVSRRTINNYLEELRLMGAEIRFSRRRNTYYFGNNFVLHATVEARIDADVLDKPHEKEDDIYNYNKH